MNIIWVGITDGMVDLGAGPVRTIGPDFKGLEINLRCVVGLPFGMHPDLPEYRRPLAKHTLVRVTDDELIRLEEVGAVVAEEDVPDHTQLLTSMIRHAPGAIEADEEQQRRCLSKHAEKIEDGPVGRARIKRVLERAVNRGDVASEKALQWSNNFKLDRDVPTLVLGETE